MSIRARLGLYISFLFIAAVGNPVFIFQLEKYGEEKLTWVNHTHQVLIVKERLLGSLKDTETGQRGYLLTENTSYLEPYHNGLLDSESQLELLKKLTSDNPDQLVTLAIVDKEIDLKFKELAHTIKLFQSGSYVESINAVKQNVGKQYMDRIRQQLNKFTNEELLLLEQRKGDFRAHKARITTLMIVEVLFFISLAIITAGFLQKTFFTPLKLLLTSTEKIDRGETVSVADIVSKDEMGHLLTTFFAMSEKVHQRTEDLDYKAHHDSLTGLQNRMKVNEAIQEAIEGLKKQDDKLAVLFLDLNSFKQLNDSLGHEVGDFVLQETARRLNASTRSSDLVFRIGGDEFLVMLNNVKSASYIQEIVVNIMKSFDSSANFNSHSITISPSIGIAIAPDDSVDSDEIIRFADVAMYAAKRDKKDRYKFFDQTMLKRASDK